ncbi:MAG TPA: TolC family protein [Gemmatimonadales bacterium]|nr:TolC family protein [Gemmatimonadales bacterium]
MAIRVSPLLLLLAGVALPCAAQDTIPAPSRTVSLTEAIERAESVQPNVVQAEGAVANAEARMRQAGLGAWLPSLTFSSSMNQSYSGVPARVDPNTGLQVGSSSGSVNARLSSSVDLFTGFRRGAESRAARADRDAADASLVDTRFQQRLTTTNQFFDALAARQLLAVRQASVRRAEEQLKVSINKLNAGSATRSDSLRSRVTLGTAQLALIQAQADLATAEAELGRLIGESGRIAAQDDSSFYQVRGPGADTSALRMEAESRSPRVQAARADADAAQASLSASKSDYWPSLSLSANTGYSGSSSRDYSLYGNRGLGLSLSWPLFNGFQRETSIEVQRNAAEVAQAQAAEAGRSVASDVTAQLANLEASVARIRITQVSVLAAQEDMRVQQERYRLGASTIVDVLTSQEALDQAEVEAVNARFDYLRAKAQMEALIGRTL